MQAGNMIRRRIVVRGLVQGIGFRPQMRARGRALGLAGQIGNFAGGAFIEVEGSAETIAAFIEELRQCPPPLAVIERIEIEDQPLAGDVEFKIVASDISRAAGAVIPPEIACCDHCLSDILDPADRRFRYPMTSCSQCGPRFTIIRSLPYDRQRTTMSDFPLCLDCEAEYSNPNDRRHHAQTTACPSCGPQVWLSNDSERWDGWQAITAARRMLDDGLILAVKGLGGFHLACDATRIETVQRLRARKNRGDKPFAMMAGTLDIIRRYSSCNDDEVRLLLSRERPIVLVPGRPGLLPGVAPGQATLGYMLPDSPLQHLLADDRLLVMTSGNLSGEPIVTDNSTAETKLAGIVDAFLFHDRDILQPCDDSVVRVFQTHPYPIRRSRGFAPLPMTLPFSGPPVLAVGSDLKSVFCLVDGKEATLSQHLGDMGSLATLTAFERAVDHFCEMLKITPAIVACDSHPGYSSARWAAAYAARCNRPLVKVQHHRAHIASLLAEWGRTVPIIGICYDGTGFGEDGAVWGGEIFAGSRRAAHWKYLPLPGGEACIARPYRMALAALTTSGLTWEDTLPCVQACPPVERKLLHTQLTRNFDMLRTSSMGRLFDAVAALVGVCQSVTYEGQAAIELEAVADSESSDAYDIPIMPGKLIQLDPCPMISRIVDDLRNGIPASAIAGRFHRSVSRTTANVASAIREETGLTTVGLTGGVFQNLLLLNQTVADLRQQGFEVLVHRRVPANDGGIALGQAVIARCHHA